ncbi:MAG: DUF2027 domain-containing protein [Tannerella sp.]|jgi:hypothetical protein|nr:DUF2027 domain-containing protein [Tannerella sp.]
MKIGDKVRFLNSVGGGIVKAFQGKNMALVEDESGFDFPVRIEECVVVGAGDVALKDETRPVSEVEVDRKGSEEKPYVAVERPGGERLNAFLAYLPADRRRLTQGDYEAYFVNDSNYCLYFNYMLRDNSSCTSRFHGMVESNTKVFMEEIARADLNGMERVCIQMIALKEGKAFAMKNALSVELRIDTVKFYKLHCFVENDYFDEPALIFPIVQSDMPAKELLIPAAELQEAMRQKNQDDASQPRQAVQKRKDADGMARVEVDLHIGQLLDSTQGMTAQDMLDYQMNVFHETLKRHAGEKGRQIVFIHGKGEGVLRAAIEKELKTRYRAYTFQDASFQEYGFGATLVKIR